MPAFRRLLIISVLLASVQLPADEIAVSDINQPIQREPKYKSSPRYALLVFGPEKTSAVWIVQDGDQLYVDKNGNGDLTDDEEPTTATEKRKIASGWDRNY